MHSTQVQPTQVTSGSLIKVFPNSTSEVTSCKRVFTDFLTLIQDTILKRSEGRFAYDSFPYL